MAHRDHERERERDRAHRREAWRGRSGRGLDDWEREDDRSEDRSVTSRWVDWQKRDDQRREPWIDPHDSPSYHAGHGHDPWRGPEEWHQRPRWWSRMEDRFGDRLRALWQPRTPDRGRGRPPRAYVRSDERIREDVYEILAAQTWIDASDVEVSVSGGEVTLTGLVDDRRDRRAMEEMIDDVPGVKDIHNQLKIRKPPEVPPPESRPGTVSAIESPSAGHGSPGDEHAEPSNLAVTTDLPPVGWTEPDLRTRRRSDRRDRNDRKGPPRRR